MALDSTQKAQIRTYLGHPDGYRYKNTRLESILDSLSPEAETQIGSLLTSLTTLDATIASSFTTMVGGVKRVDEITFFDPINGVNVGFKNGKEAGKWLVGRLSIIVGVPIAANAFGAGGFPGDGFMPGNGSGNIRLG